MLTENTVFNDFVARMIALMEAADGDEPRILAEGQALLSGLVANEAWLPDRYKESDPKGFRQYLLHRDPKRGFTVLSVAWARGQHATPHDHTVWGMFGQLLGAELTRTYETPRPGQPLTLRTECVLRPGDTAAVSPRIGDVHDVTNVADGDSVSIHVYGGDLASLARFRHRYDAATGAVTPFIADYH